MSKNNLNTISLGAANISVSDKIKILGTFLDCNLTMNQQVNETVKSCNYHIRSLRHVRKRLNLESAKLIASGLIISRLDYSNALLFGTSEHNFHKLQCVQNSLARVVLQQPFRSSSKPLLQKLHWLPVKERVHFKIASISFKTLACSQPTYLAESLHRCSSLRNLRSNNKQLLVVPRRSLESSKLGFSYSGPTVWNSLSISTRDSNTFDVFKTKLKTELFNRAFVP